MDVVGALRRRIAIILTALFVWHSVFVVTPFNPTSHPVGTLDIINNIQY